MCSLRRCWCVTLCNQELRAAVDACAGLRDIRIAGNPISSDPLTRSTLVIHSHVSALCLIMFAVFGCLISSYVGSIDGKDVLQNERTFLQRKLALKLYDIYLLRCCFSVSVCYLVLLVLHRCVSFVFSSCAGSSSNKQRSALRTQRLNSLRPVQTHIDTATHMHMHRVCMIVWTVQT